MTDQIRRGDIFWIHAENRNGSLVYGYGRPAVIVSNDMNNLYSDVVEVVFLTTRIKKPLPTHITVYSSGRRSTALCEQISSISKSELSSYAGHITSMEEEALNRALEVSIGLKDIRGGHGIE